jgi:hypothetical protein
LVVFRRRRAAGDRQLFGLGRLGQGGRVEGEGEVDLEQKDTSYGFPPVDSAATKKYRIFSCLALILAHAQHTQIDTTHMLSARIFIGTWIARVQNIIERICSEVL